jgi:hypothetical protein
MVIGGGWDRINCPHEAINLVMFSSLFTLSSLTTGADINIASGIQITNDLFHFHIFLLSLIATQPITYEQLIYVIILTIALTQTINRSKCVIKAMPFT